MTQIARQKQAAEAEKLAAEAKVVEDHLIAGKQSIQRTWLQVAKWLHQAFETRAWERLGYETDKEWLAQPELKYKYSTARAVAQVYRELVVERGVKIKQLEGADLRTLQMALPVLRDGEATVDAVVSDSQQLGRADFKAKYRGGNGDDPIDPGSVPQVACPTCHTLVDPGQLNGSPS